MPTKKKPSQKPSAKKKAPKVTSPQQSQGNFLDTINNFIGWIKGNPLLFIVFVILAFASVWFMYVFYIKSQFKQAENEVNKLSSAIITELGNPTSTDTLKSCSYQSLKYSYGQTDAMCSVGNTILYSGDAIEAERVSRLVRNTLNDSLRNITFSSRGNYEDTKDSSELNSATNSYSYKNFSCTTIVRYISKKSVEGINIEIYLGCGKKINFYRIYPEL